MYGNELSSGHSKLGMNPRAKELLDLPAHILLEIFSHLNLNSMKSLSCVSRYLLQLSSEASNWQEFYKERWPLPASVGPNVKWRDRYFTKDQRMKAFLGR